MSLEEWLPKKGAPVLFGLDRARLPERFIRPLPEVPWLTRQRWRLGAWLQSW